MRGEASGACVRGLDRPKGRLLRGAGAASVSAALGLCVVGALVASGAAGATSRRAGANTFLIVPAVSIGPVKLGESQASVAASAGPEHPVVSEHDLIHDYPNLQLYVVYLSGRVAEISVSADEADSRPGYAAYHTVKPDIGIGDLFTSWRHFYPGAPCTSTVYPSEPGTPDSKTVICLVTAANGNFTAYTFAAPEPKTPELAGIGVYVKSLRAAA